MNLLHEKRRALGVHCPHKGGGSSMSMATATTTQNTDRRAVLDDSVQVGDGGSSVVNNQSVTYAADAEVLNTLAQTMPDAVRALSQMGATVLRDVGGAVVDLNADSLAQNRQMFDATTARGAAMVDSVIDSMAQGFGLASEAIKKFQPTDNANADIGKYAMLAAAAVAAAVLLGKSK